MSELIRIGQADVITVDEQGRIVAKGKPMTNPKGMTPSQLTREQNEIVDRATRRENSTGKLGMTPAELGRFEELEWEKQSKERLHNEAKLVEAKKLGRKMGNEVNRKRTDAKNDNHELLVPVSRSNEPGLTQMDKIRARLAKAKSGK